MLRKIIISILALLFPLLLIVAPYSVIDTFAIPFSSGESIYMAILISAFVALGTMLFLESRFGFSKWWIKVILISPLLIGLGLFGLGHSQLFEAGTPTNFVKIIKPTTYKEFQIQYANLATGSRLGYFHFSNPSSPELPVFLLHGGPGGGTLDWFTPRDP